MAGFCCNCVAVRGYGDSPLAGVIKGCALKKKVLHSITISF